MDRRLRRRSNARLIRQDILFLRSDRVRRDRPLGSSILPAEHRIIRAPRQRNAHRRHAGEQGRSHALPQGDESGRLEPLRRLLEEFEIQPEWVYPTHVERNEPLMAEAIELSKRGVTVDIDVVEEDLPKWLRYYVDSAGDPARLTVSSDASITSPATLFRQLRSACCITPSSLKWFCGSRHPTRRVY